MRGFVVAIAGLLWAMGLLGWTAEASASILCRDVAGQKICIESIKRSAKYVWEYRVQLRVDGEHWPLKRYDCRPYVVTPNEADISSYEATIRQLICDLVTH